jgi:acyl-coenzyme A synthetase/AMP-(fatty) acid ligase
MFNSYFNEPELSLEAFDSDGWGYSGDIGYFDDDGFLYIVDRIKHILKFKDYMFTPHEVEEVINQIDGVTSSCVVGVHDSLIDYDITYAFVIKNKKELDEDFIINYVAKNTSKMRRITGAVIFVEEFPTTPTRKIKINALKEIACKAHERMRRDV